MKRTLALTGLMLSQPFVLCAEEAGRAELNMLQTVLTGNFGIFLGLALTVWGIFKAFAKGETGGGILLIICGVALTIFPGVFNVASSIVNPIVTAITTG